MYSASRTLEKTHLIYHKQLVFPVHFSIYQTTENIFHDNKIENTFFSALKNKKYRTLPTPTCFWVRHHGPQILHQMSCSEVYASWRKNKNPFLVGPFALFKQIAYLQNTGQEPSSNCWYSLSSKQIKTKVSLVLFFVALLPITTYNINAVYYVYKSYVYIYITSFKKNMYTYYRCSITELALAR